MSDSFLRALRTWSVLACALSATIFYAQRTSAQGRAPTQYIRQAHHSGVIATRAVVRRDESGQIVRRQSGVPYSSSTGNPQWILYGRTGFLSANPQLPNGLGSRPNTDVLSVSEYQSHAARLQEVLSDPANAERTTLTVQEYMQSPCGFARPLTAVGARFGTFHVIVRNVPPQQAVCSDYVLLETPINTGLPPPQIGADHASMLFSKDTHEILFSTPEVIARETAFYLAGEGAPYGCAQTGTSILDGDLNAPTLQRCKLTSSQAGNNDIDNSLHLFAPVVGALVWMPDITGFVEAYTDDNGAYDLPYLYYRIPGDYDIFDYSVTAQIFVATPNRRVSRAPTYWLRGGDHHPVGVSDFTNWPVDTTLLGGELRLTTVFPHGIHPGTSGAAEIGVGPETRFSTTPVAPDCQRQPGQPIPAGCFDYGKNFVHQGLLSAIDVFDLRDTDIYVYRVSDGQMLGRRWMLSPNEVTPGQPAAVFVNQMRGLENSYVDNEDRYTDSSGQRVYKPWQPLNLQLDYTGEGGRRRNPLRTGDVVKVVAINRPTGYIGTVTQTVEGGTGGLAELVLHETLALGPPNLRITARRTWVPKEGASANESRKSIIGGEGAAMATDEAIVIDTEWYDRDGSPLPQDLPGFTGRLARVCAAAEEGGAATLGNAECAGSSEDAIELFKIKPGHQTEVIQLPAGSLSAKGHYYVQIDGTDFDVERPYDPETIKPGPFCYYIGTELICNARGAGEGPLLERPATFVPVLVPYYDRGATEHLKQRYEDGELDEEPKPVYRWVYRPEMHFSLFELEVRELERTDDAGQAQDLRPLVTDNDATTIPVLGNGDTGLDLVALLVQDQVGGLPRIGTARELVLQLGSKEITLVPGTDGGLHLDASDMAELESDDVLTVQLLQRYDEANVLWEFAFARLLILPSGQHEMPISADEPTVAVNALLLDGSERDADEPPSVQWTQEGTGVILGDSLQVAADKKFSIQLQVSTVAGATSRVAAALVSHGGATATSYSPTFRTVPGKPASLSCSTVTGTKTVVGGLGGVEVRCTLIDQHANAITDHPVLVKAKGLDITSTYVTDVSGFVGFVFRGAQVAGDIPVSLSAGDAHEDLTVRVHDVALAWSAPATIVASAQSTVTISATSPYGSLEGLPVNVAAHRGKLSSERVVLNSSGQAAVTLETAEISGLGRLYAHVGETTGTSQFDVTAAPNVSLTHSMLIGDATTNGNFPVTLFPEHGGTALQIPYFTSTALTVNGAAGQQATVRLESVESPAREAVLRFPMQVLPANGLVVDAAQGIDGTASGVTVQYEGPRNLARSYRFRRAGSSGASAEIRVPVDAALDLQSDVGFSLWVKPSGLDQNLVEYVVRNMKLSITASSELEAQVIVGGSAHTVRSAPVNLLSWHQVAVAYRSGQLTLVVDGVESTQAVSGPLTKNTQTLNAVVLGRGYEGLMSSFEVVNWASEALVGFSDGGGLERQLTFGANGSASVTITSTGVQTTAAERVLRKWERRQKALGDEGMRVAFAADLPQECSGTPVPEDALDAAHAFMAHLIHCELKVEAKKLDFQIVEAGISRKAVVLLAERARVEVLTSLAIKAQTWLEAVECSRAVATGESNTTVGKTCAFVSDLLFIGDLRDLAFQLFYFYTNSQKYDTATHVLAGLGLITELLAILTAETGAGAVAGETANVAAASAKFIVKAYNKAGALVRGLTDNLIKVIDFRNPADSLRALNKLAPFIEIAAIAGFYHQDFAQIAVLLEEMITDTDRLLVVANFFNGYYEWFNGLTQEEQNELAQAPQGNSALHVAWAAPLVRAVCRKLLEHLRRLEAHALELKKVSSWPSDVVRADAHQRIGAAATHVDGLLGSNLHDVAIEVVQEADKYTHSAIEAFQTVLEAGGEEAGKRLASWRGMIGANRILDVDKLYRALSRLRLDLSIAEVREGFVKVVKELDIRPDVGDASQPKFWYVMAKSQGAAFHIYAMELATSAGALITAVERKLLVGRGADGRAYERIYDYVVQVGNAIDFREVKSWKPDRVIANLRAELKFSPRKIEAGMDDMDIAQAVAEAERKGPGQLYRDLVNVHGNPNARVTYELREGSPSQAEIREAIRDALDDQGTKASLMADLGVTETGYREWADEIVQQVNFVAIPNP